MNNKQQNSRQQNNKQENNKQQNNKQEKQVVNRRETVIALLFATLIICGVYWVTNYAYFDEKNSEITKQQDRLTVIRTSNQILEQIATNLPLLEQQSEKLDTDYKSLAPLIPEKRELPNILERIQRSAMQRQLRLDDFAPAAEKKALGALGEIPIRAQITGDEVSLKQYLLSLNRFERILHINSLDLSRIETGELAGNVKANIDLSAYISNTEAKVSAKK
jgi:Tfp pilus assembly protein PilO